MGDYPASELYVLTFQYTLSVPSSWVVQAGRILPACMTYEDGTDSVCHNVGTYRSDAGDHPKE
jgi:hypothetical protein